MINAIKDPGARMVNLVHRTVFRLSGGRLGNRGFGMPVVMLETVGRKSGKRRSTMLTSPLQDGDQVVLVASYGGDERNPAWFLNLRDKPDVEVAMKGAPKRRMRARAASPEERARLWPIVTANYKNYAGYQTKTQREIPLVLLEPEG